MFSYHSLVFSVKSFCHCQASLEVVPTRWVEKQQKYELSSLRPIVAEHQAEVKR